jgi:hypothetical protein
MIQVVLLMIFFSCNIEPSYFKYEIKDLSNTIKDTLVFDTTDLVTNVEILIKGNLNGKAVILFENGSGRYNKIDLEGLINEYYKTEWYDTKLHFVYKPLSEIKGDSIVIEYRMY